MTDRRLLALVALTVSGCLIDRSSLEPPLGSADARGPAAHDAGADPGLDAVSPRLDAVLALDTPRADAYAEPDAWVECSASGEACNATDDDCDGAVDEGVCGSRVEGGGFLTCDTHRRGDRAYLACPFTARWDQARAICRTFSPRYDLAAFADGAEQDAVRGWIRDYAWIGLSDSSARIPMARDGDYRWVDGSALTFTAWRADEPATEQPDGCVVLYADGTWDAASCAYSYYNEVVCEAAATR